jgi:hypothetical protein
VLNNGLWLLFGVLSFLTIEKVFPEIVRHSDDHKTLNYNGLIGVLIEGMKEQQKQINILMNKIKTLEER